MPSWIHQIGTALPPTPEQCHLVGGPASSPPSAGPCSPQLAALQPERPPGARDCSLCKGTGYIKRDHTGRGVVCPECGGLGWKPL